MFAKGAGNIGAQERSGRVGRNFIITEESGDEPGLRGSVGGVFVTPANRSAALEKNPKIKMLDGCGRENRLRKFPFLDREITAGDEVRFGDGAALDSKRLDFSAVLLAEANHVKCFLDVQCACATVRIAAIVIVNAVSDVGVLLNLAEDISGTDCVNCARRNEDGIAGNERDAIETIFSGAACDGVLEIIESDLAASARRALPLRGGRARRTTFPFCPRPPAAFS